MGSSGSLPPARHAAPRAAWVPARRSRDQQRQQQRGAHLAAGAGGGAGRGANDGDDDVDELSAEFARIAKPDKFQKLAEHLNLMWRVSSASQGRGGKPQPCASCRGTGETECSFCHGTGSLTIGDTLYCSETGCSPCPVCESKGAVPCSQCTGTGFRASWLDPAEPSGYASS